MPRNIKSECRLFADDALIYNKTSNYAILKQDLKNLEEWSKRWQMSFNVAKCAFLQVGKQNVNHAGYEFCGGKIKQVKSHEYLGVHLQSNLKWDTHINNITTKAIQKLALLKRTLRHSNTPTRKIAYYTIVRPTLEYACQIWDPHQKDKIHQLEKVQNRALKFIFNIKEQISFTKLRENTNIKSLRERRKDARMSLFVRCFAEGIEPTFNYNLEKQHNTRQKQNTYTPYIKTNIYYYSF